LGELGDLAEKAEARPSLDHERSVLRNFKDLAGAKGKPEGAHWRAPAS